MPPFVRACFLWSLLASGGPSANAGNWPHWRGPQDNGSTETIISPTNWSSETGLLWKADLPGKGCSTPIIWQKQIFLTGPVNGEDALLSFDWSGKQLWQTTLGRENSGKNVHGSGSNPSPVTDGKSLFVFFKSGHFAALDFSGHIQWKTDLIARFGKDTLYWDYGTSPVLTETDVVLARLHHGDSYLAAFDKQTGDLHWKVARNYQTALEGDHSYATPLLIKEGGKEALLVLGGEHLTAHDASDGKLMWECGGFNPEAKKNWVPVASPVIAGDIAIVPYGRGAQLHGIRLGGHGDVSATHRAWLRQDCGSFVSTPAEYNGRVYLLHDHGPERGMVECLEPNTGKTIWRESLPKGSAEYYASPLVAEGKLYAAREDGTVFVASIAPNFGLLSENAMDEPIIASPIAADGRLFIRAEKHLFCIGSQN
ncbi:MAG TPA: PQQ-binding-like beta-propeller repeat protein [Candidatus Dormibacteraeota bacterium]|nr:PQQ-binding-like beta-propeller repeat protein [Candidatus Dormibacteraeota bacterium]